MGKKTFSLASLLIIALLVNGQNQVPNLSKEHDLRVQVNDTETDDYSVGGYTIGTGESTWWEPNLMQTTTADSDGDGHNDSEEDYPFNPAIPLETSSQLPFIIQPKKVMSTDSSWTPYESTNTIDIEWSDVNGDGYLDMVVVNVGTPGVSPELIQLFVNEGGAFTENPSWALSSNIFAPINPIDVELIDVDGDLDADLILAAENNDGGAVFVYENLGGVFSSTPQQTLSLESIPRAIEWGDMDDDGDFDLVVGFPNGIEIYYWEDNQLMPSWNVTKFPDPDAIRIGRSYNIVDLELGDLDRDGDLDVAVANWGAYSIAIMNEKPDFSEVVMSYDIDEAYSIAIGDINGNGYFDIVLGTSGPSWCSPSCGGINELLLFNPVNEWYSESLWDPSWIDEDNFGATDYTMDVNLGDVDRDGDLDLIVGNIGADRIYLNLNGIFSNQPVWNSSEIDFTNVITFADIDADGYLEIITGVYSGKNRIYMNDAPTIEKIPSLNLGTESYRAIAVSGLESQNIIALANENSTEIYVEPWSQLGDESLWESGPTYPNDLVWGDLDSDGDEDLVVVNRRYYNSSCSCFEGGNDLIFSFENGTLQSDPSWISADNETSYSVDLVDINNDGYMDMIIQGSRIHFYLSPSENQFTGAPNYSIDVDGYSDIDFGDLDDDGFPELLVANGTSLSIYPNNNGQYDEHPEWQVDSTGYRSAAFIDLDLDGDLDVSAIPNSWFNCANVGRIHTSLVNDDVVDCSDGSDEGVIYDSYKHAMQLFVNDNQQLSQQPIWNLSDWEETTIEGNEIITSIWDLEYVGIEWIDMDFDGTAELILEDSSGIDIYCKVPLMIDYKYCDYMYGGGAFNDYDWIDIDNDEHLDALLIYDESYDGAGPTITISKSKLDSDGDGMADEFDEFQFNPTQISDRDGDKFGDNPNGLLPDSCPFSYGTSYHLTWGCRDLDSDGYGDSVDDCFTIFGISSIGKKGCPDSDADGLADSLDQYYGYTGGVEEDWDADNRGNSIDVFPTDNSQWMDSDGDGFGDNYREESKIFERPIIWPGELIFNATLVDWFPLNSEAWEDSDRDGYTDQRSTNITDDCPTVPGNSSISLNGCPDLDGDGIPDILDADIDGDHIFNTWEYQTGYDPFDVMYFPIDTDKDGIPNEFDDDDDNDGFPDDVEIARGSNPKSAESDPLSDYGGGFYYIPGEGFESSYQVNGFEISLGSFLHLLKSELIVPIVSSVFAIHVVFRKKRLFKEIRNEIEMKDSEEDLAEIEEVVDEKMSNKKITVTHALILRSIIQRKKIKLFDLLAYISTEHN